MIKLIILNHSIMEWQLKGEIQRGYFNRKKNCKLIIIYRLYQMTNLHIKFFKFYVKKANLNL